MVNVSNTARALAAGTLLGINPAAANTPTKILPDANTPPPPLPAKKAPPGAAIHAKPESLVAFPNYTQAIPPEGGEVEKVSLDDGSSSDDPHLKNIKTLVDGGHIEENSEFLKNLLAWTHDAIVQLGLKYTVLRFNQGDLDKAEYNLAQLKKRVADLKENPERLTTKL